MKNPLISIIIPCYNGEKFISKTLKSVLDQTYTHWETIVVNDGSTDNSAEVLEKWSEKDSRISIIHQVNMGLSSARNSGLKIVKGDYIFFFDADDLIDFDALEDLVSYIKKYKTADIVFGKTATTSGHNFEITGYLEHGLPTAYLMSNFGKQLLIDVIENPMICTAHNNLYKTSFVKKNNLSFKPKLLHEDELWFFETLFFAEYIILNKKPTYFYNLGNEVSITNNFSGKNLLSYCDIIETIYDSYYCSLEHEKHKEIISIYIDHIKIKTINHCYKQLTREDKKISAPVILDLFSRIKNSRRTSRLSDENEKLHHNFRKIKQLHPNLQMKSLKYIRSKNIISKVKNYFILKFAKKIELSD